MIAYIETLPMILQVIIVIGCLFSFVSFVFSIIYRLIKYGIKIKAGRIEIDASEENN
jgi:hypothetical protein